MFSSRTFPQWRRAGSQSIAAIAVAILLMSRIDPAVAATSERTILVVDGAQNVEEYKFDDTYWQLSYTIDLKFPWLAIDEPQWERLEEAGWSRCRDKNPGWDSFIDASVTSHRLVHQHAVDWLKGNRMISIVHRYYSAAPSQSGEVPPDNTNQRVFILFDDDVKGHNTVEWLSLDCS